MGRPGHGGSSRPNRLFVSDRLSNEMSTCRSVSWSCESSPVRARRLFLTQSTASLKARASATHTDGAKVGFANLWVRVPALFLQTPAIDPALDDSHQEQSTLIFISFAAGGFHFSSGRWASSNFSPFFFPGMFHFRKRSAARLVSALTAVGFSFRPWKTTLFRHFQICHSAPANRAFECWSAREVRFSNIHLSMQVIRSGDVSAWRWGSNHMFLVQAQRVKRCSVDSRACLHIWQVGSCSICLLYRFFFVGSVLVHRFQRKKRILGNVWIFHISCHSALGIW